MLRTSAKTTLSSIQPINVQSYLYHSIGGFDLYKMLSIVKNGILSKLSASRKNININSTGLAENGNNRVSLSTSDVLSISNSNYAGGHLSFIIDPKNLSAFKPCSLNVPFHEIQVNYEVPPENIVGIIIPEKYMKKELTDLPLFQDWSKERFICNVSNLNSFMQKEFSYSIFSDKLIQHHYDEIIKNIKCNTLIEDYLDHERKLKKLYKKLNSSIFSFIHNVYKEKLKKTKIGIMDIIKYHLGEHYPLFNAKGEILTSQIQEQDCIIAHHLAVYILEVSILCFALRYYAELVNKKHPPSLTLEKQNFSEEKNKNNFSHDIDLININKILESLSQDKEKNKLLQTQCVIKRACRFFQKENITFKKYIENLAIGNNTAKNKARHILKALQSDNYDFLYEVLRKKRDDLDLFGSTNGEKLINQLRKVIPSLPVPKDRAIPPILYYPPRRCRL